MMNGRACFATFPDAIGLDRILLIAPGQTTSGGGLLRTWPLPEPDGCSCNVVVIGDPGTGKSTLALQLSAALRIVGAEGHAREPAAVLEPATVLYYSLEQSPRSLMARASGITMGCADTRIPAVFLRGPDRGRVGQLKVDFARGVREAWEAWESKWQKEHPKEVLPRYEKPSDTNLVLFPDLSPRRLEQTGEKSDDTSIFWDRLSEIRTLIEAFKPPAGASPPDVPALRMVVIDSLNVFGDRPVSRYLIEQLFSLFHRNKLIAVFIAEDPEASARSTMQEPHISPGITNLADVVIKLAWRPAEGYSHRSIEIVKSRHASNAYGPQQMKLRTRGIEVYPSLHRWHSFLMELPTPPGGERHREGEALRTRVQPFNLDGLDEPLRADLEPRTLPSLVQTIAGPRTTFKGRLALAYAKAASTDTVTPEAKPEAKPAAKLEVNAPGEFLLVSFEAAEDPNEWTSGSGILRFGDHVPGFPGQLNEKKGTFRKLHWGDEPAVAGYQLWMVPGYLVGEELIHFVFEALVHDACRHVTRVIFRDIGQVPTRHPYIARQIREYGNFFTVLIELCRRMAVDCLFVCGTNDPEAVRLSRTLLGISHLTYVTRIEKPGGVVEIETPGAVTRTQKPVRVAMTVGGRFASQARGDWSIEWPDARPVIKPYQAPG